MSRHRLQRLAFLLLAWLTAAPAVAQLQLIPYASGFTLPVAIVQDPTDAAVQFVVEQGGRIRVIHGRVVQATDFLDLTGAISSASAIRSRVATCIGARRCPRCAGVISSPTSSTDGCGR